MSASIGKETDRRWEQGEDISLLESKVVEYRPNETARLGTDQEMQHDIRKISIRALAQKAGVSESTVKAARHGDRLQKKTIGRLQDALNSILGVGHEGACRSITSDQWSGGNRHGGPEQAHSRTVKSFVSTDAT
jgi:hypothetical protein